MKRIILLIGLLLLCAYAVSETWGDASSRVNFYYQYDGGTTDEPGTYDLLLADRLKALCGHDSIYYNSNTNKYLTGRGCCLFSFAHAYQYLCGYSGSNALKADILYRFLSTKPVWSDTGSSLSPPNAAGIYAQSLAAQPGVNSYGASLSTFSKLKAFFEGRQSVLIMNVPGHYFCAVGCIEHGGVQYVQVIDSTLSGTIRTGRCTQAKSFDFSQTYTPANVLNYAAGVHQYWLPYSEFSSKCRIKYAYRAAKAPAVNPLTTDRDELILLAGESAPMNIQGTDRELEYICSDETVASGSEGGVVHALAPGRACVTCRIKGSPGISLDIQL